MSRKVLAVAALAAAFFALAGLVVAGALQRLDQYAIAHWMPGFTPSEPRLVDWRGLVQPFRLDTPWWHKALELWTYPASFVVSGLLVAGLCVFLWRRGQTRAAVLWAAAWVAGNAIELLGKETLDRPTLHWAHNGVRIAIPSFHDSFPSGHTIRGLLVAALVVYLWRRALWPAVVWFVLVVLGGLLVGLALVLGVQAVATAR
jgi:hypothetical protein